MESKESFEMVKRNSLWARRLMPHSCYAKMFAILKSHGLEVDA